MAGRRRYIERHSWKSWRNTIANGALAARAFLPIACVTLMQANTCPSEAVISIVPIGYRVKPIVLSVSFAMRNCPT